MPVLTVLAIGNKCGSMTVSVGGNAVIVAGKRSEQLSCNQDALTADTASTQRRWILTIETRRPSASMSRNPQAHRGRKPWPRLRSATCDAQTVIESERPSAMSPEEIRTVTNWLLDAGFTVTVVKRKPLQLLVGVPDEAEAQATSPVYLPGGEQEPVG
jgi:hypothetical protein